MNLLQETKEAIKASGHSYTWAEFCKLADIEYDNDFGAHKVASDLVIVFSDGGLRKRHNYDGSEEWRLQRPFAISKIRRPITRLVVPAEQDGGWLTLKKLNEYHRLKNNLDV